VFARPRQTVSPAVFFFVLAKKKESYLQALNFELLLPKMASGLRAAPRFQGTTAEV
jgi:hypothetical protein